MRSLRTRLELAMWVGDAQGAQDDAVHALASGRKFFFCDGNYFHPLTRAVPIPSNVETKPDSLSS